MITLKVDRAKCIGERTCGKCRYYLDPLKYFLVMGGDYAFAVEDFERLLPEIEAAISSCEWGALNYAPEIP